MYHTPGTGCVHNPGTRCNPQKHRQDALLVLTLAASRPQRGKLGQPPGDTTPRQQPESGGSSPFRSLPRPPSPAGSPSRRKSSVFAPYPETLEGLREELRKVEHACHQTAGGIIAATDLLDRRVEGLEGKMREMEVLQRETSGTVQTMRAAEYLATARQPPPSVRAAAPRPRGTVEGYFDQQQRQENSPHGSRR